MAGSRMPLILAMIRPCLPALLQGRLAADLLDHERLQPARRHHQLAPLRQFAVAGQVVEQRRDVLAEVGVAGEEAEVGVDAGRLRVVIAGGQVDVTANAVVLAAHHQGDLAVRLQADEAEDDVHAGLLQLARPDDVAFLVEAGLQLDDGGHLLAVVGGALQGPHDRRIAAGAIQRLLDGQHALVVGRRLDEIDDVAERLVGMMDQDVAIADGATTGSWPARTPAPAAARTADRAGADSRADRGSGTGRSDRAVPDGDRRRSDRDRARSSGTARPRRARRPRFAGARPRRAAARRTSSSMVLSRSSTSSSSISMSLLRVTRKTVSCSISMPGNSSARCRRMTFSSGVKTCCGARPGSAGSGTKRGSTLGTCTTANNFSALPGRCSTTARLSDLLSRCGNGWPGSMASGVSTGKISRRKTSARCLRCASVRSRRRAAGRCPRAPGPAGHPPMRQ